MKDITEDGLKIIYNRSISYAIAKYGVEPHYLKLWEGDITAVWDHSRNGDYDIEEHTIYASNLTEDLDSVSKQRKVEIEEQIIKDEAHRKEMEKRKSESARLIRRFGSAIDQWEYWPDGMMSEKKQMQKRKSCKVYFKKTVKIIPQKFGGMMFEVYLCQT